MREHHFVFRSAWRLPAPPGVVYDTLADVAAYPAWWPQVKHAEQLDERSGALTCRSTLPYEITFVLTAELEDPDARTLRARLDGDLIGWSQWSVHDGRRGGSIAVFEEDVVLASALLSAAGRVVGPVLKLNHDAMMKGGERGLREYLTSDR